MGMKTKSMGTGGDWCNFCPHPGLRFLLKTNISKDKHASKESATLTAVVVTGK